MVRQHDDGQLRPDSFDLIGDGPAIEKAEVEFDDNGIHGSDTKRRKPSEPVVAVASS